MKRRTFARLAAALPLSLPAVGGTIVPSTAIPARGRATGKEDRAYWLQTLLKVADPVLSALAKNQLKATMPVESAPGQQTGRMVVSHLEALGRTMAGVAPWLELNADDDVQESNARQHYLDLSRQAIANGVNPKSPDYLNFTKGGQPLVDAAFLAHGLVRSPKLWHALSTIEQGQRHQRVSG